MAYGLQHIPGGEEMAFRFEGLDIFHAAVDLSVRVHELIKKLPTRADQARAELLGKRINAFRGHLE
jgi:hypothetical protein